MLTFSFLQPSHFIMCLNKKCTILKALNYSESPSSSAPVYSWLPPLLYQFQLYVAFFFRFRPQFRNCDCIFSRCQIDIENTSGDIISLKHCLECAFQRLKSMNVPQKKDFVDSFVLLAVRHSLSMMRVTKFSKCSPFVFLLTSCNNSLIVGVFDVRNRYLLVLKRHVFPGPYPSVFLLFA